MKHGLTAAVVAALTLINFFQFPGHTWLQSDTQIYAPILEHFADPSVLGSDPLVQRPHVSFTIYDETTLTIHRITGLSIRRSLQIQQILFRALGIWGVLLMATSIGLAFWPAVLVTAIFSLGATVLGPTVLVFEYEPVPRGFAVPLLFLAIGLTAHQKYLWAGASASFAFLIHPPTVWPFWGIYFLLTLRPTKPAVMRRRLYGLAPLIAAAVLLFVASQFQAGVGETQAFFQRLEPEQEKLQRMRSPYVYISIWAELYWKHFVILLALAIAAYFRLRRHAPTDLRYFLIGLPLLGALSVPLSWWLLEKMKWALMPQVQPMRALLFLTAAAIFGAAAAACKAGERGRWPEAFAWLAAALIIPINTRLDLLPPNHRTILTLLAAFAACAALWVYRRRPLPGGPAICAVALALFFAIPEYGKVVNYPKLRTEELMELSSWARQATPRDAVFLFPEANRALDPGIFRANALRTVYVDWKGGGQVNYLRELGELWWRRWQMVNPHRHEKLEQYRQAGVDYIVLTRTRLSMSPSFDNGTYRVYRIRP
jgi:hypothetical protein